MSSRHAISTFALWITFALCLVPARPASAGVCSLFARLVSPRTSRDREQKQQEALQQVTDVDNLLTRNSGGYLSASQYELFRASDLIDQYFYLNEIGTLVTLYNGPVTRVERAFLQRQRNLADIDELETAMRVISKQSEGPRPGDLGQLLGRLGLLRDGDPASFVNFTDEAQVARLKQEIARLRAEIPSLERIIGRDFDVYREVRKHLSKLLKEGSGELVHRVEQADNRERIAPVQAEMSGLESVSFGPTMAAAAPRPPESEYERKQRISKEREQEIEAKLTLVDGWRLQVDNNTVKVSELRQQLSDAGFLSDTLRNELRKDSLSDNERAALSNDLETLRNRLNDAKALITQAVKLDNVLGLKNGDFALSPSLLTEDGQRPSVEDVEKFLWESPTALRAKAWRDLRRTVWNFLDASVFLGFTAKALPSVGSAANIFTLFRNEKPRDFVYSLFRGLYDEHVTRQYFPSLTLLRRAKGEVGKLATLTENLNAGTNDELLLTFARRTDLKNLWQRIRAYAERHAESDHQKLFDRMKASEERARDLGMVSVLQGPAFGRYVTAFVVQGTLAALFGKHELERFCSLHGLKAIVLPGTPAQQDAKVQSAVTPDEEKETLDDAQQVLEAAHGKRSLEDAEAAATRLEAREQTWRGRLCHAF